MQGVAPFTRTGLDALTGTATYEGDATGLYVRGDPANVGSFAAKVALMADFDTGSPATVTGSVSEFQENGVSLGRWQLLLGDALVSATASKATTFRGDVTGGADGARLSGRWGVRLYENGNERAAGDEGFMAGDDHPGYAAGTFNASTGEMADNQVHILGAFGAEKQPQATNGG